MKFTNFINYSTYSNGLGLLKLKDIIKINKENNSDHAVLTDHMTCMAFPEFNDICDKNNLKPIFGLSVSIENEDGNLIFIARNDHGIQSLRDIVTNKQTDNNKIGYTTWDNIRQYAKNLIIIAGNENSLLGKSFYNNDLDNKLDILLNATKDNNNTLYLDIQERCGNNNKLSDAIFKKAISTQTNVLATSTNRTFKPNHIPLLKQKLINQVSIKEETLDWKSFNISEDDFAKTSSFMHANFFENGQSLFINNTTKLAGLIKECTVFKKPSFPSPNDIVLRDQITDSWKTFKNTIPLEKHELYKKRISSELAIIENLKLEDYFKTFQIMAQHAAESEVAFAIRGSGSSSLVVHMLGVSSIDPVKNGLLFERFLNYKRAKAGALPDIDFDTSNQIAISTKLSEVFGAEHIATLTNTDSIKNYSTSLGMVEKAFTNHASISDKDSLKKSVKEITKLIPIRKVKRTLSEEIKSSWKLKNLYKSDKGAKFIIDSALTLEEQVTIHKRNGASLIVSKSPIANDLSVKQDPKALVSNVAEISKGFAESVGFIKLDVLANNFIGHNLSAYKSLGIEGELHKDEYNDKKVFKLFKDGDIASLFQMTSIGSNLSKEMQPENFSDIVVLLGLIRPGVPKDEIETFITTKNKKEPLNFEIKELNSLLSDTYGVIIFEEQLMKISQVVGGFSPDESDELRRTIKNKDKDKLSVIRTHFVKRGIKKNPLYSENSLNEVFNKIESKADGYMFNQAHAIVYADICYKQAKIKANYPGEYMNFYLNMSDNKQRTSYIDEAINRGVYFNAPNINKSTSQFSTAMDSNSQGVVPALSPIVGEHFANNIINERLNKPFTGVFDITSRMINKSLSDDKLTVFDINDDNKSPRITLISKNISSLITVGFLDQFAASQKLDDIVDFRNCALASMDEAVQLSLNPFVDGDFSLKRPSSYISLDKFIEIETKNMGLSPLSIFQKMPIKNDELEKKRSKKGSLNDFI